LLPGPLPDSLCGEGVKAMFYRAIAILAVVSLALGAGGCASKSHSNYEEVLMPLQTGSTIQRRVYVPKGPESKSKKKKKEKEREKPRKSEAEPSATPAPEEESTPPPDRFR
jgi:hypothetical protein